jgi:aspartate/methionine/tyrosine aminotransferase
VKVEENKSHYWTTKYEKEAKINLSHSTATLFSFEEIFNLQGGTTNFISKIKHKKVSYGQKFGSFDLRKKVSSMYGESISEESILLTNGCSNAIFLAYYTFLDPGDELIITIPTWWPIISIPASIGASVKFLKTRAEDAFIPNIDELDKTITKKTKMIVITNPNNPSGSLMSQANLQDIILLAEKAGIWILCDEVYKGIESDISTVVPSITEMYVKGLTTSSVSKVFGIPGVRIGWISGSKTAIEELKTRWDYIVADCGLLDQHIAGIAIDNFDHIMELLRRRAIKNRKILNSWVASEPMIDCPVMPVSGTTAFLKYKNEMDAIAFTTNLVRNTGTYVVPGTVYDKQGEFNNFFRIGYMVDPSELEKGLNTISSFLQSL